MDHDKIVDSLDAVISDEALAALLDRTLQSGQNKLNGEQEQDTLKKATSVVHSEMFKILAERDSSGNVISGQDDAEGGICGDREPSTSGGLDTTGNTETAGAVTSVASVSSSTTPEPASSDSMKSSSSVSISSSLSSDSVQSVDIDANTPASSALTSSFSPTPEPSTGGVVVADTEVNICAGEMEVDSGRVVSTGCVLTS